MKYKDVQDFASELRSYADFIESNGHELKGMHYPKHESTAYLTETSYERNPDTGEYETVIKDTETKRNLASFLAVAGNVTKDWNDSRIILVKSFGRFVSLRGYVDRAVACKKVPTGETRVIPSYYSPERTEEVYEWVCEDTSLIKIANS